MRAEIQVLDGNGYVWDADVALWLRQDCGIVGAMVGGVAAFKQQNAVHGLPLELSPEEVTLALERGWATLAPCLRVAELAAALESGGAGRKRGREASAYQYYEEDEEGDADMEDAQQAQQAQQAEPTWRAALTGSSAFVIPTTPAEAAAANAGVEPAAAAAGGSEQPATAAAAFAAPHSEAAAAAPAAGSEAAAAAAGAAVEWTFPATEEERHRYWVFKDLHSKGYRITGGSKFGADYLVYPGDPTLYHAQFCVRLLPHTAAILPAMLSSATRGSHQARKHLLIASVTVEEGPAGQQQQQKQQQQGGDAAAAGAPAGNGQVQEPAVGSEQQPQQPQEQRQEQELQQQQQQEQGQQQQPQQEQQQPGPVQPLAGGGGVQLGRTAGGVGAGGERYRIHYLTIGPVEGFGG